MESSFFTNKYTNIAKGVAVFLLLFHHLGLNPELNIFAKSQFFTNIALQCKVCVSIFVMLSGYGLNSSINRKDKIDLISLIKFSYHHLIKMMVSYWTIFILFISFGCISGRRTLEVYGGSLYKNISIDFLGLSNYFTTPTYNATWWFMSLIIILYLVFPIFKTILKRSPIALILLSCIIRWFPVPHSYAEFNQYALIFCLGMVFSEFKLFDRIRNLNKFKQDEIILSVVFLIVGVMTRFKFESIFDLLAMISIILASNNILSKIPKLNNILELLGRHSANIFMMHTFIYKYFFSDFFRGLKYPILMYLVLVLSSLSVSLLLEMGKKYIKIMYENLNNKTNNIKAVQ